MTLTLYDTFSKIWREEEIMKRSITVILLLAFVGFLWGQSEIKIQDDKDKKGFDSGYADGYEEGSLKKQTRWAQIGCAGGCVGSIIGGGAVWYAASRSGDEPDFLPEGDDEYIHGFIAGYYEATKSKRAKAALQGCVGGTLAGALIVLLAAVMFRGMSTWN